ncbi:MAG: beta-ketoacyl synthase N-terminal-like domain-containing protein, partial [Terriglobales bacterium]
MKTVNERKVHLVGAGPGDPELLTVKAHALLSSAELILHDDLVTAPILALASPQAMVVNVGKRCGVKKITRFDASDLPVQIAGEVQDFNELDWLDAKEMKHVSRCVPLAIAASTEALSDAGIDPAKLSLDEKREIGVALGTGGGANDFTDHQYHLYYQGKIKQVSIFTIPSGTMGTMSSEVSMRFGFRGLSHVVTSGCTSSTDAIAYATRQIQLGTQPVMLVGGVDSPLAWGIVKAFTLMRIMTDKWNDEPERGSRPFNADRDGFVLAEGSWMFVLEDYD